MLLQLLRKKLMNEKSYHFYDIFSQFLSICTRSQNFNVRIFIERKHQRIENGNKFLLT